LPSPVFETGVYAIPPLRRYFRIILFKFLFVNSINLVYNTRVLRFTKEEAMRKTGLLVISAGFVFMLAGCVSTQEMQSLQSKVSSLETDVRSEQEISAQLKSSFQSMEEVIKNQQEVNKLLRQELEAARRKIDSLDGRGELKMPEGKDIQAALKNAGFYQGEIDGVIGRETKEAIKKFQEANNLNPDGVPGSKTWSLLKKYLTEKTK
jgi:murein L,D-transpeptidase YcbB/YkuD